MPNPPFWGYKLTDHFKTQLAVDRAKPPVPAGCHCSEQYQPAGTGESARSTAGWVLKWSLNKYVRIHPTVLSNTERKTRTSMLARWVACKLCMLHADDHGRLGADIVPLCRCLLDSLQQATKKRNHRQRVNQPQDHHDEK